MQFHGRTIFETARKGSAVDDVRKARRLDLDRGLALKAGWTEVDFARHFFFGAGRSVSLREIGYLDEIRHEAERLAIRRSGGFLDQIGERAIRTRNGRFGASFTNSYDFGGVHWVFGGGTLTGYFLWNRS